MDDDETTAGATGATGDTGDCGTALVVGGGCQPETGERVRECTPPAGPGETGLALDDGLVVGGGCGVPVPALSPFSPMWPLLWLAVGILWLARRRGAQVAVLLGLLGAVPGWAQVDAQRVQLDDGGAFPVLWEADLGEAWHAAATLSVNHAQNLAVIELPDGTSRPLLDRVLTWQAHASWNVGGFVRFGASVPVHDATVAGRPLDRPRIGDTAVWLSIPVRSVDGRPPSSWTVRVDVPSGPEGVLLRGRGAMSGVFASAHRLGPLELLGNLGASLSVPADLPGARWGPHVVYGGGVRVQPLGPIWLTTELDGALPLRFREARPTHFPLEGLLSAGLELPPFLSLGIGVGTGLTRGLGTSALRVTSFVDVRPRPRPDRDADGIPDSRDFCIDVPEDRDGYRDRDGCPDADNDEDGFLDAEDRCPDEPEVVNAWYDADGCPDQVTDVAVIVEPHPALGSARVHFGEDRSVQVEPGARVVRGVGGEAVEVVVEGLGFHPHRATITLNGGSVEHRVVLEPLPWSIVRLEVVDEAGTRLDGAVVVGDAAPRSASGRLKLPVGRHALVVSARDHLPRTVHVDVPPVREVTFRVVLRANPVEVRAGRVRLPERIHFPLEEATVEPESGPIVAGLAAWLEAHPEVALLRIEGHADASGTSRYNYALSLARAEAVRDALIAHGIDPERLLAIGSGEAGRRAGGAGADRRVEFLVLVWE